MALVEGVKDIRVSLDNVVVNTVGGEFQVKPLKFSFITSEYSGSSDAYCGTGCQSAFGTCTGIPIPTTTTSSSSSTSMSTTTPSPTSTTLADCLLVKNVPISLISSPNFVQLAQPYNLRLPYTPAVIALPTTPQHISDAVICAGKSGIKVQVSGFVLFQALSPSTTLASSENGINCILRPRVVVIHTRPSAPAARMG